VGKLEKIAEKLAGKYDKTGAGHRKSSHNRSYDFSSHRGNQHHSTSRLKDSLIRKYEGSSLIAETEFESESTEYGETLHLRERVDKAFVTVESSVSDLLSDLKLVYGVGSVREKELKRQGYRTIEDLRNHEKWGDEAKSVHDAFHDELPRAYDLLSRWKSLSDPSFLRFSGLFNREEFAIVDIETLGLSNQPVFLLGLAHPDESGIVVHQFLARNLGQELATLMNFTYHLNKRELILTYNGKNFDIPYIERRLAYYGQRKKFSHPHLDLYLFTRNILGDRTRNCKLGTIERKVLGVKRYLDVPSALVPDFYNTYMEKTNPGPLLPILAHNRQDLLSLVDLYRKLGEESLNGNR